jgi:hypothetical protein
VKERQTGRASGDPRGWQRWCAALARRLHITPPLYCSPFSSPRSLFSSLRLSALEGWQRPSAWSAPTSTSIRVRGSRSRYLHSRRGILRKRQWARALSAFFKTSSALEMAPARCRRRLQATGRCRLSRDCARSMGSFKYTRPKARGRLGIEDVQFACSCVRRRGQGGLRRRARGDGKSKRRKTIRLNSQEIRQDERDEEFIFLGFCCFAAGPRLGGSARPQRQHLKPSTLSPSPS